MAEFNSPYDVEAANTNSAENDQNRNSKSALSIRTMLNVSLYASNMKDMTSIFYRNEFTTIDIGFLTALFLSVALQLICIVIEITVMKYEERISLARKDLLEYILLLLTGGILLLNISVACVKEKF